MSTQEQNNSGGRGQGSGCRQTQKHNGGEGGRGSNGPTKFRGAQTDGVLKDVYICLGDSRPSQFSKLEKLLPTYALSRKQTRVAIIIVTNMPLGTTENFINAYPEGTAAMEQAIKIWEQKAKGQQEEFNAAVKGQQDMMMAILGQCDEPTKAQVQADEDFANIMNEGRILDFIQVLCAICYDTSASRLLF